jgi:hypothetical protein
MRASANPIPRVVAPAHAHELKGQDCNRHLFSLRLSDFDGLLRRSRNVCGRADGTAFQVMRDVFAERRRRLIALRRLFPESLHDDVVQGSGELGTEAHGRLSTQFTQMPNRCGLVVYVRVGQKIFRATDDEARRFRLLFADDARHLMQGARVEAIGTMARQELIQQHAQRVDIAQESDGQALHLFGACVLDGHHAHGRSRLRRGVGIEFGVQEFGDAEVEELRLARLVDQNVRGLDVAVYDLIAMCVLYGRADLLKEVQALAKV